MAVDPHLLLVVMQLRLGNWVVDVSSARLARMR
jgi:hypothetical protein